MFRASGEALNARTVFDYQFNRSTLTSLLRMLLKQTNLRSLRVLIFGENKSIQPVYCVKIGKGGTRCSREFEFHH